MLRQKSMHLSLAILFCIIAQASSVNIVAGFFFPSGNSILYFDAISNNVQTFYQASATDQITALAFDWTGQVANGEPKLYFAVESTSTSKIYSCNFTTNCTPLTLIYTHTSALTIGGIALDTQNKKVLWVADNDIWKGNPDGTLGVTIKLNLNDPRKLAVSTQGEVFVSLASKNGKKQGDGIGKMLVDGSSYVNMLTGTVFNPSGICVDSNTSTLYIIDLDRDSSGTKKIVSAATTGTNYNLLINTNLALPESISFYSVQTNLSREIFWIDSSQRTINKYNIDLGGRTSLLTWSASVGPDLALRIVTLPPSPSPTPTPSRTPSTSPSTTPSTSVSPSKMPSPSPTSSPGSSPTSSPSITPSASSSSTFTPSVSPSSSVSAAYAPTVQTASASASSTPSPSASTTITPSLVICSEVATCQGYQSPNVTTTITITKRYNRVVLLAIIVIPFAIAFLGSAAFIASCLVLLRKERHDANLIAPANSLPLQKQPTPPVHPPIL